MSGRWRGCRASPKAHPGGKRSEATVVQGTGHALFWGHIHLLIPQFCEGGTLVSSSHSTEGETEAREPGAPLGGGGAGLEGHG